MYVNWSFLKKELNGINVEENIETKFFLPQRSKVFCNYIVYTSNKYALYNVIDICLLLYLKIRLKILAEYENKNKNKSPGFSNDKRKYKIQKSVIIKNGKYKRKPDNKWKLLKMEKKYRVSTVSIVDSKNIKMCNVHCTFLEFKLNNSREPSHRNTKPRITIYSSVFIMEKMLIRNHYDMTPKRGSRRFFECVKWLLKLLIYNIILHYTVEYPLDLKEIYKYRTL
ncbi:hypothetical protein AGLY_007865 [Aphis glycines]|uniref:PiggyBac transposable element-derived protein domain-containing protein n=1 Tax=Aphis glycines TaxID=307491 RepID=A0A6G0TP44_APHGL|nr:hypothetical protein AGLY_007865 [Aphis glycines]